MLKFGTALAAATVAVVAMSGGPDDSACREVFALYLEDALGEGTRAHTPAERAAFNREWHDRLVAVAELSPDGPAKTRALSEAAVIARSLGDRSAAIEAAEAQVEAAGDVGGEAEAMLYLAKIRFEMPTEATPPDETAATAAAQNSALALLEQVPPNERSLLTRMFATDVATQAAKLKLAAGRPADAATDFRLAAELERQFREDAVGGRANPLFGGERGDDGRRQALLRQRAAAEIAAGESAAAGESVRLIAAERSATPSAVALEVAGRADLEGAGGTFLAGWLADAPADAGRPAALFELAVALDRAGRDDVSLSLFGELREEDAATLAGLPETFPGRSPHAEVLARLAELLKAAGADGEAAAVMKELRERFPDAPTRIVDLFPTPDGLAERPARPAQGEPVKAGDSPIGG